MAQITQYECPVCGVSVGIGVTIPEPPTHECKKRLNKVYELEKRDSRDSKRG
jgi:hypothetical protein